MLRPLPCRKNDRKQCLCKINPSLNSAVVSIVSAVLFLPPPSAHIIYQTSRLLPSNAKFSATAPNSAVHNTLGPHLS